MPPAEGTVDSGLDPGLDPNLDPSWRPRRLWVASGNPHKVDELRRMLAAEVPSLQVLGLRDGSPTWGPVPRIDETADDFAGNARLKAEGIAAWLLEHGEDGHSVVLSDDSGVCVDALEGAPGVWSARFAGPGASDADNNAKLVRELQVRGLQASRGHYRCVLALARVDGRRWPDSPGPSRLFEGRWDVELRVQRRGAGGFGYDPHAWLLDAPPGGRTPEGRTVAELSPDDKAARSHRGQAMRALLAWFRG
ncbi:non-canonical purine NTP pyrophosphatase [Paraliomyxa miuraensis]|uniref:non-canonical purine NTP pyrophosphatase n=1 Tax=Paraliomyxa miuraensis TaxID=376150 RepID=UPI00225A4D58|nr:non-canonical purine NTP pyrophosphatase [Paraliomyxa miuraensis]MCX4245721.1 non-canonical purine NTP pyrophosphatase [Paraliomyxa miuraensis]